MRSTVLRIVSQTRTLRLYSYTARSLQACSQYHRTPLITRVTAGQNIMCASMLLLERFAYKMPMRIPIGHKPIDRRAYLTPMDVRTLPSSSSVSTRATNFADVLPSVVDKVVARLTRRPRIPEWFEFAAMQAGFKHVWNERKRARSMVRLRLSRV